MAGTSRKGFVLGLAIGVLIGAAGAVIVARSGFGPARKESQAERDARVLTMKPEQFAARCGNLMSDKLSRSDTDWTFDSHMRRVPLPPDTRKVTVRLTMPGGEMQDVTAVFYKEKSQNGRKLERSKTTWSLTSVGGYDAYAGILGELKAIEELYPCTTKP